MVESAALLDRDRDAVAEAGAAAIALGGHAAIGAAQQADGGDHLVAALAGIGPRIILVAAAGVAPLFPPGVAARLARAQIHKALGPFQATRADVTDV